MCNKFAKVAMTKDNEKWQHCIGREKAIYHRQDDIRTEFGRDYTRILHCLAYRRLKHKTQVFFNTQNDHICTRMEHVAHVESISYSIARELGLNTELTKAIAMAHDLGHAPFGHTCEKIIEELYREQGFPDERFWHEKNGLRFVDKIELLENCNGEHCNLNLTYAVRDGIISHCGEVDDNGLFPRAEAIDFIDFQNPGQFNPYTWEGCIVKVADKIAYLGRDIEDAIDVGLISRENLKELNDIIAPCDIGYINTSKVIHELISDLVKHSSPDNGIVFSDKTMTMIKNIKAFNYRVIYGNERMKYFHEYSSLIVKSLFKALFQCYDEKGATSTMLILRKNQKYYNELMGGFADWLTKYCDIEENKQHGKSGGKQATYKNEKIYGNLQSRKDYMQSVVDYISGMTDSYAIKCFEELVTF
ncbi:dGTPase [Hathewaya proteolytica DSM 3090]|uniref:dGTPase n=1 Tax=Hathewaya proteolytica DSM 3090 TaxID=1121331 RepID=A0A1M6KDC8_9CLOT|nr:HD domain-containing protein [Hathewaya proteolytica]SHJ56956.1 dGTPase [Hathewaya proteolytica DSM 3090]